MPTFLDRLNQRLVKTINESHEIDPKDQAARKKALSITRGPCTGWDDYVAGNDYQPPYVYDTVNGGANVHKGRAGNVALHSPAVPIGFPDNGHNPHSSKYNGIRPWSPDEVSETLGFKSDDPAQRGLAWDIALKNSVQQSFAVNGRAFAPEDVYNLGLTAAWRALQQDRGAPGVRFTSFVGQSMEEAMTSGVPAGFKNEYKDARGMLGNARAILMRVYRVMQQLETTPPEDVAKQAELQDSLQGHVNGLNNIFSKIDPVASPQNKLGVLAPRMAKIGQRIQSAIDSGESANVERVVEYLDQHKEDITSEEELRRDYGPNTDTMIRKSKTQAPIRMAPLSKPSPLGDKELEVQGVIGRDQAPMASQKGSWVFQSSDAEGEHSQIVQNPTEFLQTRNGFSHNDAQEQVNSGRDIPVRASQDSPAGTLSFQKSNSGDKYETASDSIRDDPQMKEFLTKLAKIARGGMGQGLSWTAGQAREAVARLNGVISKLDNPPPRKQYKIEPYSAQYEIQPGDDEFFIVDANTGEVAVKDGLYTITRAKDVLQKLQQQANGFKVTDAAGEEIGRFESEAEARTEVASLTKDPFVTVVASVLDNVSRENLGQYADDLIENGKQLLNILRQPEIDRAAVADVAEELQFLDQVAAEDQQSAKTDIAIKPLTQVQYRIFLRLYGIDDYVEKGTVDDPEIGEDGQLSQWAKSGYHAMPDIKSIANEFGISSTAVSQHKKKIDAQLPAMSQMIQHELSESGMIDEIDYMILTELRIRLSRVFVEGLKESWSKTSLLLS